MKKRDLDPDFPLPSLSLASFILMSSIYSPFQTSPDGNVTLSIINYVPSVRDAGKYMSCKAENPELPDSSIEDGWKLEIHCELSPS